MLPPRTILHPTDFSRSSRCAFQVAGSLARGCDAQLLVLHVIPPSADAHDARLDGLPADHLDRIRDALHQLQPLAAGLRVQHRLAVGDPATVIVDLAAELSCDLIVMGARGWSNATQSPMGRVTEKVLSRAACPVLTVQSPVHKPHLARLSPSTSALEA